MRHCLLVTFLLLSMGAVAFAGEVNIFNPYLHAKLPSAKLQGENAQMARSLGGSASSLQAETSHRKHWRQEVYPVVFGNAKAPHEIIVFLDYASPDSAQLWAQVVQASHNLAPQQVKIVVFGKSTEPYATELMGGGIWVAYSLPQKALEYYTYTLQRWNDAKQGLAARGIKRRFVNEYDATVGTEVPILYGYLERVQSLVPPSKHFPIVSGAFDAGNVNMYQAGLAAQEYDVKRFPAVVVNGKTLANVSAQSIINALR